MKLRLLKRIKSWEQAGFVSATDIEANEIMESVCDDLEKLFNTRSGTVLIDHEYGLSDFTHLWSGYAAPDLEEIELNLSQQIRQYEKRLTSVSLTYQQPGKDSAGVKFGLNATFEHKKQDMNLAANIEFSDNGSVSVSL
jgi:type VI secretion system protein